MAGSDVYLLCFAVGFLWSMASLLMGSFRVHGHGMHGHSHAIHGGHAAHGGHAHASHGGSHAQANTGGFFDQEPFGELERLVTQKLLDVAKRVAKEELESEEWLRLMAQLSNRSYEQMRVAILEFLDTDVFNISVENCIAFLDPLIESWDIDLKTFGMEIVLNRRLTVGRPKRFEFVEREPEQHFGIEPGLEEFLRDTSLSSDVTEEEIEFLQRLKFREKHPAPIYYYRELQNLRDPLHFRPSAPAPRESD
jgi:hypothetical protein